MVDRREDLLRLAGVDDEGNVQLARQVPDRIEVRIVDREPRAVGLPVPEAELLEHLQADRAVLHRLPQTRERLVLPSRAPGAVPADVGEDTEAILVGTAVDRVD